MNEGCGLRWRTLAGPEPWRPDPEPVWLAQQLGDVDPADLEPLPPDTARELSLRTRDLSTAVSVIIPTWNRSATIERAIDSALAQTYAPREIIVVDDGSTDSTVELIRSIYLKELEEGRLKLIERPHEGVCPARNAGLEAASGDVITYLDSDNEWLPDYLAMVVSAFADDDSLGTVYTGLRVHTVEEDPFVQGAPYDRRRILRSNYVDLNIFAHRRWVYDRLGGFDPDLVRLVDWDLILRYTALYPPLFIPAVAAEYYLDEGRLQNITFSESWAENNAKIQRKQALERRQLRIDPLRIAYVAWDYPALSQTFFHREVQALVDEGYDVHVYWLTVPDAAADIDPRVPAFRVEDADHLARLLVEHERNMCHSHFAYPATTLLTYEACVKAGVEFTFMPHAVDLFQDLNRTLNKVAQVANHPLCRRVFVYGDHHADFLMDQGVRPEKISYAFQAVDFDVEDEIFDRTEVKLRDKPTALVVARFIEKKGISVLLEAVAALPRSRLAVKLVGYGPLEEQLREEVVRLGIEDVDFAGVVRSEDELAELYAEADVLVVPSVVASNGDMDGFPTVILEAMSVGLPVVTTDVSAIPDYISDEVEAIVVESNDAAALADGFLRLFAMSPGELATMTRNAAQFVTTRVGTKRTVGQLLDQWEGYTVDICLVTFDRDGYRAPAETLELIRRVRELTTTPFHLIIVDNASDNAFVQQVLEATAGLPRVTFVQKQTNVFCGPASNIAFRIGRSELAIYLCSKEAFPLVRGWERPFIDHFRRDPDSVIAGHLSTMPGCVTGREYAARPDFERFRHPELADTQPDRRIRHIQGGLYGIRRSFVESSGGFNEAIPHGGMDVEYSYAIEALGHDLDEIPGLVSLTNKTLPKPLAHLDSASTAVHPLTCEELAGFEHLRNRFARACNCCGWVGDTRTSVAARQFRLLGCPDCGSSSLTRTLVRVLANDPRVHSGFPMLALSFDPSIEVWLGRGMFSVRMLAPSPSALSYLRDDPSEGPAIVLVDGQGPSDTALDVLTRASLGATRPGSAVIAPTAVLGSVGRKDVQPVEITLADRLLQPGLVRYSMCEIDERSGRGRWSRR